MTVYLRQIWTDPRLADPRLGKGVTLNYNQFNRLWVPDLFVRNEKRGQFHMLTVPNRLLRLHQDGTILYSQRYIYSSMIIAFIQFNVVLN